jgi:ATP-binding protein involved in chromosome partitioning
MTTGQDKLVDLIQVNVEVGWNCDFRCEDCYRFFDCPSQRRQEFYQGSRIEAIARNLSQIKHIIAVMSGKGGVGKSIISANLAVALANRGYSAAIMDSDLYGPSIPSILGIDGARLKSGPRGTVPPQGPLGIKVVSMDFLMGDDDPVTWFSDLKRSAQEQFLANTDYGDLDYLIIDMPPGTGSETVNLLKYLPQISGAIIVTMSSEMTERVVHRCISLCQRAKVPIIGLIENMGSLICSHCGKSHKIEHGSGAILSRTAGAPILGKMARDPLIVEAADKGLPFLLAYPDSEASKNFYHIVSRVEESTGSKKQSSGHATPQETNEGQLLEIIEINVDRSCYRKSCFNCCNYFQCRLPRKENLYDDTIFKNIREAMAGIKHKIAVMSCKGGVGKSTFAANLAVALAQKGRKVTILDCDFHGPCIPKILGADAKRLKIGERGIIPNKGASNVGVISMDFLIRPDEPVTWFDPLKKVTITQFLYGVDYGSPDYLIIDLPPGTGAESYGLLQYTPDLDGAIIITLPSESPQVVARRSIGLCRQAKVPIIGLVENMSHFVCTRCNKLTKMCGTKKTANLARKVGVPFLGDIPLDSHIFKSCDQGVPFVVGFPESGATLSLLKIATRVKEAVEDRPM